MTSVAAEDRTEEVGIAGQVGFWSVVVLAVLLGVHPPGSSELYNDGQQFVEHVNAFWVTIHFLGTLTFIALLLPVAVWGRQLASVRARVIARLAFYVALVGTAIGSLHLIATDTAVFLAFSDTYASGSGSEAVEVGADRLLRFHASTLTAWALVHFVALPVAIGLASKADGRFPSWYPLLTWAAAALAGAAVVVAVSEGQWSTLSDMALFRPAVVLLIVWFVVTTWWMRRGEVVAVARPG